jgi:hypothetical protein
MHMSEAWSRRSVIRPICPGIAWTADRQRIENVAEGGSWFYNAAEAREHDVGHQGHNGERGQSRSNPADGAHNQYPPAVTVLQIGGPVNSTARSL